MRHPFILSIFLIYRFCINAQVWIPVGTGVNGPAMAIKTHKGELYVGGAFLNNDGTMDLLKWNDTTWSSVNRYSSFSNSVRALEEYDSLLLASGMRTPPLSSTDPSFLAVLSGWNGINWQSFSASCPNQSGNIDALVVYNNELYVGGYFSSLNGVPLSNIAKWNGSNWETLGTGVDSHVVTMEVFNGELYVGGVGITSAGGVSVNNIAKWNGSNWSNAGAGLTQGYSIIRTLYAHNGELYVGGDFSTSNGATADRIAKWNGISWFTLGSGMNNTVYTIKAYNNGLYVGGEFTIAGGVSANRVAKWNGSSWLPVGQGMDNLVLGFEIFKNDLYACGTFTTADNFVANHVAKLNNPTNLNEETGNVFLNAYPVPFSDFITIDLKRTIEIGTIFIYDMYGNKIKEINNIEGDSMIMERDNLPSGVYYIHVYEKSSRIGIEKIIVLKN